MSELRDAVEKLNSDVRNYLTPILAYGELISQTVPQEDRRKVEVILECADKILASLQAFVDTYNSPNRQGL